MATLVLTVVGTVLGGPIGGAIGATLGQVVDQQLLFAPKGRQGPRLTDLRLQTSSYGTQIPRLYGSMRVAGTVIWSTDLKEARHYTGGGKGQPDTTTYSYSASFAVALSSRPIGSIGRIWADGNLLRGAGGDYKTELGAMRVCNGQEDQPVDPLMGAANGAGLTPAYRGLAYVLFEDLQLADYGNRIPSLTFEVFADVQPPTVQAIACDLAPELFAEEDEGQDDRIKGYAALGSTMADAIAPLVEATGLVLRSDGGNLRLQPETAAHEGAIARADFALSTNGKPVSPIRADRGADEAMPARLSVRYYDPARDYQAGLQTAIRQGGGRRETVIDLPASVDAAAARHYAEARLRALWTGRAQLELLASWTALPLPAGAVVSVEGQPGQWRIESSGWEDMLVRLKLRRVATGALASHGASAGGVVSQPDLLHGPTRMELFDLPGLTGEVATAPIVVVAANGEEEGWRRASLYVRDALDATLASAGSTALPAIMGTITVPPLPASPHLFDLRSAIIVSLLQDGMALGNASDLQLAQGANLCLAGDELLQFGLATPLGGGVFRLERLLRGRRGTESAMAAHGAGERFVLLDQERLFSVPSAYVHMGSSLTVDAIGIGDMSPVERSCVVGGRAVLPLAPVHVRADVVTGSRQLSWTRRSRAGWRWLDGADAPLGEERELYLLEWVGSAGVFRTAQTSDPHYDYDATQIAADLAAGHGGVISVRISQIGTFGVSAPALISLFI